MKLKQTNSKCGDNSITACMGNILSRDVFFLSKFSELYL